MSQLANSSVGLQEAHKIEIVSGRCDLVAKYTKERNTFVLL